MTKLEKMQRRPWNRDEPSVYIIYGYREREGKNRWYIGCKVFSERSNRHKEHKRAGRKVFFHNFINKAYRDGKTFEQALDYFEIETFRGTARQAEARELHYTKLYNAEAPGGFVTKAGGYKGRKARMVVEAQVRKQRQYWSCQANRDAQAIKCSGWSHDHETKKEIGRKSKEMWSNPDWLAAKTEQLKLRKEQTKKRKELMREEKQAERESRRQANPSQTMLCERIVLQSPAPLTAKQVANKLSQKGIQFPGNRVITQLKRAAGYNDKTHVWEDRPTAIKAIKDEADRWIFLKR